MITLRFNDAKFRRRFTALIEQARNPAAMMKAAGRELHNQLKSHFRMKDRTEPNPLSDRRSHFWLAVSRTVGNPVLRSSKSVTVTIAHPAFAQKVFGGVITAKRAGALTIPVEERAYGRTAATFEHETGLKLFLLRTGKGHFQNAVLAVREGKGITVEYILTKSVNQRADRTALPFKPELEQAILDRAESVLERQVRDEGG